MNLFKTRAALLASLTLTLCGMSRRGLADESMLASITVPRGAVQFPVRDVPHEITDVLQTMAKAGGDRVSQGETEVFSWSGGGYKKSAAATYKAAVAAAVKRAGWEYEEGAKIEGTGGYTLVTAVQKTPVRKMLIGFWAPTDDALLLAWTEVRPTDSAPAGNNPTDSPGADTAPTTAPNGNTGIVPPARTAPPARIPAAPAGAKTFEIDDSTYVINAMKGEKIKQATFPALTPKSGWVRGFVKDGNGKPLKNATLVVVSTAVGGARTGAQGKTDAKGYYEIMVPFGVARISDAGYPVDYGDGIAPLGLYPEDGELDDFASANGYVKNWTLLPYGIGDRADLQSNAKYANNYFGGQIVLHFYGPDSFYGESSQFPNGATLEVTLTPKDPLVDGSTGPTFVFHKVVREGAEHVFYVNNLPLTRYRISGRALQNGRVLYPLNFQETGPYRYKGFGVGSADGPGNELLLRPYDARVDGVGASHGHWAPIEIDLKH